MLDVPFLRKRRVNKLTHFHSYLVSFSHRITHPFHVGSSTFSLPPPSPITFIWIMNCSLNIIIYVHQHICMVNYSIENRTRELKSISRTHYAPSYSLSPITRMTLNLMTQEKERVVLLSVGTLAHACCYCWLLSLSLWV